MITTETRVRLMATRDDVFRASDRHNNLNLLRAVAHIDRAMMDLCPHLPETWTSHVDEHSRGLTTCHACRMSWYDHENDARTMPYATERQQAAYMASPHVRLETRALEHGFAYVTPLEGERLLANDLFQPGHTIHRYSSLNEDRSDSALDDIAREDDLGNE